MDEEHTIFRTPERAALVKDSGGDRELRVESLKLAFSLLKGTDLATDYQSIVRAARTFQAYIEEG